MYRQVLHPRESSGFLDTHTLNFLLIQTQMRGWAMKELLEMIAKALVDHPEEVNVRSVLRYFNGPPRRLRILGI